MTYNRQESPYQQQYELEIGIHWRRKNYTVEEERRLGAWKVDCHSRGQGERGGGGEEEGVKRREGEEMREEEK